LAKGIEGTKFFYLLEAFKKAKTLTLPSFGAQKGKSNINSFNPSLMHICPHAFSNICLLSIFSDNPMYNDLASTAKSVSEVDGLQLVVFYIYDVFCQFPQDLDIFVSYIF